MNRWFLRILALALAALPCAAQSAQQGPIWSGVYTEAQALRGKTAYDTNCTTCHNLELNGTATAPALHGDKFMAGWWNTTVETLFRKLRDSMPYNYPDTVSENVKLDILTYLLQRNGFPAGTSELKLDEAALAEIPIVRKGETGIPNFALVETVGCLSQGRGGSWVLTSATDPVTTKEEPATANELKDADHRTPGAQQFLLVSVHAFQPEQHAGQKMVAKGLLYRDADESRINLTSLQTAASGCPGQASGK